MSLPWDILNPATLMRNIHHLSIYIYIHCILSDYSLYDLKYKLENLLNKIIQVACV